MGTHNPAMTDFFRRPVGRLLVLQAIPVSKTRRKTREALDVKGIGKGKIAKLKLS
jgi:hypothetical protein